MITLCSKLIDSTFRLYLHNILKPRKNDKIITSVAEERKFYKEANRGVLQKCLQWFSNDKIKLSKFFPQSIYTLEVTTLKISAVIL